MNTSLLTDRYELTMLRAAIGEGIEGKKAVFEAFARKGSNGKRLVLGGTNRILTALSSFRFDQNQLRFLQDTGAIDEATASYLSTFAFKGQIRGLEEGQTYVPNQPVLEVQGTFGECLVLETLILSILNADSAVATKADAIVRAANGKTLIEMGSRRVHEQAAVSAARIAWLSGFAYTSNLQAGFQYGVDTSGTSAHAWTLAHTYNGGEKQAFAAQIEALGVETTLLIDTFDISDGVRNAVEVAQEFGANGPGAVRIDSGDLLEESIKVRKLLDELGATDTRIVVSSDLDELVITHLEENQAPIDAYGVGTRLVSGLTAPGFVYKLVGIEDMEGQVQPVEKKSENKVSIGGAKKSFYGYNKNSQLEVVLTTNAEANEEALKAQYTDVKLERADRMLVRNGQIVYKPTLPSIRRGFEQSAEEFEKTPSWRYQDDENERSNHE